MLLRHWETKKNVCCTVDISETEIYEIKNLYLPSNISESLLVWPFYYQTLDLPLGFKNANRLAHVHNSVIMNGNILSDRLKQRQCDFLESILSSDLVNFSIKYSCCLYSDFLEMIDQFSTQFARNTNKGEPKTRMLGLNRRLISKPVISE